MDAARFANAATNSCSKWPRYSTTGCACSQRRHQHSDERAQRLDDARERGSRGARERDHAVEVAEQRLKVRRERRGIGESRPERARGGPQLPHHGRGVAGEPAHLVERRAQLGERRRQDPHRLGELAVARRRRRQHAVAGDDQTGELALPPPERAQDGPRVAHERPHRAALLVQDREEPVRAVAERVDVAERVVQVLRVPVGGERQAAHEPLEVAPGPLVERPRHLVELDRGEDLLARQVPAIGQLAGLRVARGELHVRLAEQRLLAEDGLGVTRNGRVLRLDLDQRARAVAAEVDGHHAADLHARDAHVGRLGQLRRLVEVGAEAGTSAPRAATARRTTSR